MSDDTTVLLSLSISISISIVVSIVAYLYYEKYYLGYYGTYIDTSNETQYINSLPAEFTAKSVKALFPGCIPKPNFNPVDKAPTICNKGMFKLSGEINSIDGGFTEITDTIVGKMNMSTQPSGSTYTVKLSAASDQEYRAAQKLING